MAVFYRINALSRVMELALRRAGIPYRIARESIFIIARKSRMCCGICG